jgi:hypothetical protein
MVSYGLTETLHFNLRLCSLAETEFGITLAYLAFDKSSLYFIPYIKANIAKGRSPLILELVLKIV